MMHDVDAELNDLSHRVIGAAIEVHRRLGPGFLESTYQRALAIELTHQAIPHVREAPISLTYRDLPLGEGRLDFLVADRLVVELKTVDRLAPIHKAQALSYLKATRLTLALLINLNVPALKDGVQRIVLTGTSPSASFAS